MVVPLILATDLDLYQAGDADMLTAAADAAVRAYCGWHIAPSITETVTVFEGFVDDVLMLPTLRLTDVTEITIDALPIDLAELQWSESGYIRPVAAWWPASWYSTTWRRSAVVTMTHGFDTVPPEIVAVVLSVASRAVTSPNGVVRAQVGQVSQTYTQAAFNVAGGVALLDFEKKILDQYRIPRLA